MHLETLKIFCDVVRSSSFSRGAAANGISQSSASQAVQNLEERLGVKLIDRSKRPLVPTPQGRIYFEGCRDLIAGYYEVENRVRELGRQPTVTGTVRVASIYSVGLAHMSRYAEQFHERYPGAECRVDYLHPDRVLESVREEMADLGLISYPKKWPDLTVIPWREEDMLVSLPPGHRLAREAELDIGQLDGEKFVHFDPGLSIRRAIDRFLRSHGVQVEPTLEFDNIEHIKRAVEVGAGISILPEPTLTREIESGTLAAIRLREHRLMRPLAIIHRGGGLSSIAATKFLTLLTEPREPVSLTRGQVPVGQSA